MGTTQDGSKLAHSNVAAEPMDVAYSRFRRAYPAYETTGLLSELRAREYQRLDEHGQIYLDYTGGGLYADSQLRDHMALLAEGVFGNPHSTSPASEATTVLVERARSYVLEYFNALPEEYVAIFTANATGAIKLVGESYPFGSGDQYLLTFDNPQLHQRNPRVRPGKEGRRHLRPRGAAGAPTGRGPTGQ